MFQYFCSHEKWVGSNKRCYLLSCLSDPDMNTWKWKLKCWSLVSYSSFDVKPKCFQSTAKIKELASLFQYFLRGVYIYIYIDIWRFNQNIFSIWKICFLTLCWFPNIFRMYLPYRKYVLVAFRHSSCWRISCLNDCLIWIYAPPKSMVVF